MKSLIVLAVALLPGVAFAQSANTPIDLTNYDGTPALRGTAPTVLVRPEYCKPQPADVPRQLGDCDVPNRVGMAYVDLGQFARDADLLALSDQLALASAQLTADFQDGLDRAADRADQGAAMAGALDFIPPADGAANRIGAQAFTMGDRAAVGVSYTRAAGQLDLGIGVATSGNRSAGKVGIGLSW